MKSTLILYMLILASYTSFSQNYTQTADYVIENHNGVITAKARPESGLIEYSGSDAYKIIQSAITALCVKNGGEIFITSGTYYLSDELIINGWDQNLPPNKQLVITGTGYATQLIQNTPDKNAIVLRNKASIVLSGLYIYTGTNSKSGILMDDSGANSDVSVWGGTIDNVFLQSNSNMQPAFYGKNFFDLNIPHLTAINNNNNGIVIENTSKTTNYGNSNFGFIRAAGSTKSPYAGLYIKSSNSNGDKFPNLITFQNYECVSAYRGIWLNGAKYITFAFIDAEGIKEPIFLDGSKMSGESRSNKFLSGYILPLHSGTAITNTLYTGDNEFNLYVETDPTITVILDEQKYRPVNTYNLSLSGPGVIVMKIVSPATPITIKKTNGSIIKLPSNH